MGLLYHNYRQIISHRYYIFSSPLTVAETLTKPKPSRQSFKSDGANHTKKKKTENYGAMGVSSNKKNVHRAIRILERGIFPGAFCNLMPDYWDTHMCQFLHADTAGTIPALAALVYKLTDDLELATNVAVNAAVMNLDDVACVGAIDKLLINQIIAINTLHFGEDRSSKLMAGLVRRLHELCQMLNRHNIKIAYAGGETASVPNTVRTFDVASNVSGRMYQKDVIDASRMRPGDLIVGFSSAGQAKYERSENSGIGSNGLTLGIHALLGPWHRIHFETYAPELKKRQVYRGKFDLNSQLPGSNQTVVEALLSPTRTYLPLIAQILRKVRRRKDIHGLIHFSGGGMVKMKKFGEKGNRYVIDSQLPIPPIFPAIQEGSETSWKEMHEVFNVGQRLGLVTPDEDLAEMCIELSRSLGIDAQIIGKVSRRKARESKMTIVSPHGIFDY